MAKTNVSRFSADWDPTREDVRVRMRDNPGKQGQTTGRVKSIGTRLHVEVRFGPNEVVYKPISILERCDDSPATPIDELRKGRFGNADDLRLLLTLEKVRGRLTNVFYSMEASNTDFYPHQFKSVLKFLDSPTGHLLIADEVGLGKTIEATYIWKELQAREEAQRLLIVCPAMLQEKWQTDLLLHFNIDVESVTAHELSRKLKVNLKSGIGSSFAYVCSLEGLRPGADWFDESNQNDRAILARMFDQHPASEETALFDLVIIDEAHYLRNPETASNRLARLLRETTKHLVLLTATPLQTHNANLYQLLRLIDPEFFFSSDVFEMMLQANKPVVAALRSLWNQPPQIEQAKKELAEALSSPYFSKNPVIRRAHDELQNKRHVDEDTRVRLGYKLESTSLIGQYLTRTRKRDVMEQRVERAPQVLTVRFSELESRIYRQVTQSIRERASDATGIGVFREIARQRQMASCMVAALKSWEESGKIDELLWEDLGISAKLDISPSDDVESDLTAATLFPDTVPGEIDYATLEQNDSKYKELLTFLKKQLRRSPKEKFVLFAYFRGTLHYLLRRLSDDGVRATLLLGGMGDEKWEVIQKFREPEGPNVLLSSEVGSEGIDLQFSRFIINYDLPWNPMRVEQRIGRLDRIGQKAKKISIVNFSLKDTIEDRVLQRLYDRIQIFRESLGEIEEILGRQTESLLVDCLVEEFSEEEMLRRADQIAMAIAQNKATQEKLEREAINMVAFSDYIMEAISRSREKGRWLQPRELQHFVEDFFHRRYPGTWIKRRESENLVYSINLSDQAKVDLNLFLTTYTGPRTTRLHRSNADSYCFFDPKQAGVMGRQYELIDQTHPLVQWIKSCYEIDEERLYPVSAICLDQTHANVSPGCYVFAVQRWEFTGLRRENRMVYKAARLKDTAMLADEESERFVSSAIFYGTEYPNASHRVELKPVVDLCDKCDMYLSEAYERASQDFRAENETRCDVQQRSATDYTNRRVRDLELRIGRFRDEGKRQMVPPTEGLIKKAKADLELRTKIIEKSRSVDESFSTLALGVIQVE